MPFFANIFYVSTFLTRAMEVWGSMEALERERKRRKEDMEEGERYRKGTKRSLLNAQVLSL